MARQTKQQIADQLAADTHAAQQAELKRLRAEKTAATRAANKATKAKLDAHIADVQPEILHANVEDIAGMLADLPSAKRVMIGAILGILSSAALGYGIGMLASYAIAGIMVLTTSTALAIVLSVLAWAVAIYAGWYLSGRVGGAVFSSVVMPEGLASRSYESISNAASSSVSTVKGWFTRKPVVEVSEFTGAHAI